MSFKSALSRNWPEYLIEAWALGCFMMAVSVLLTLFESPKSPVYVLIPNAHARTVFLASFVGTTLTLLIQSP